MGCDIHAVFQKKTPDGWQDVESVYEENRHYALFAWLGNVRNGYRTEPLSDNRGFPDDFCIVDGEDHPIMANAIRGRRAEWYAAEDADPEDENHMLMWMGDHSHSWLAADEIINGAIPPGEDHFSYFIDEVKRLKELHGEVRIVFGFDS